TNRSSRRGSASNAAARFGSMRSRRRSSKKLVIPVLWATRSQLSCREGQTSMTFATNVGTHVTNLGIVLLSNWPSIHVQCCFMWIVRFDFCLR
ncbi:hypothetical protein BDV34DRAFT_206376, partial [Aspergillus parasiticus]